MKLKKSLFSQRGQSTVEYVLLLAVIVSLAYAVLRHEAFRRFFGPGSEGFLAITKYIEHSYRHGGPEKEYTYSSDSYRTSGRHWSYTKESHFFGPKKKYPD